MDNADWIYVDILQSRRRNVRIFGFQKELRIRQSERVVGRSINCWSSCSNVGNDVSIVIDRFSSVGSVHPSTDTDIPSSSFIFYGTRPARARFFYANCRPCLSFSLFNEDRSTVARNIEPFTTAFPREEVVLVLIILFIPRAFFHLDSVCQLWRNKIASKNLRGTC